MENMHMFEKDAGRRKKAIIAPSLKPAAIQLMSIYRGSGCFLPANFKHRKMLDT